MIDDMKKEIIKIISNINDENIIKFIHRYLNRIIKIKKEVG